MLWDNVLVRELEKKGKVILADRQGSIPNKAVVVAVGPGDYFGYPSVVTTENDVCRLAVGDKVYFSRDRAMEVELKGERLFIIRARDILGILTADEAK